MTLRHFEIFKMVAETGNFRRAAEKLYITQSAVSHAIRELEEQTGTLLFDRFPKGVQMTKSGLLLLEEIQPILAACKTLESRIRNLEGQAPIFIVSSITIATFFLPKLLKQLYKNNPDISAYVEVVSAAAALEILRAGKADVALIEGTRPHAPFLSTPFASHQLKIVCSPDYPISKTTLSMEEFCSERLLLREHGSAVRDILDSALYLTGHTAFPSWCSVNSSALLAAAKAGLGIAVLPETLVREELLQKKLISLSIPGLSLENKMHVVLHKDKYISTPLQTFLSMIEAETKAMPCLDTVSGQKGC